ncbi:glutathione S-transferase family protein [Salinisphaera hydrothermalis]|uniref:Glutathione S-transferase-like protein n=1 Tax=Salinisphaera hydrothermalis (strain C41B8) TaxID=1304275 RepID=A0A084IN35_SALHC|nr:glutathione S-transferase C-terminal domain-containing protein [Salinisphaera hydrothermalis]KEZ78119.1 glutathione S-transferase-like protein [Salinisphaera hydrothermalis C41B8]
MIDFYYWPTPNGWKISILLEELGVAYRTVPVDINAGDQFDPEFLAISPNNRMPAIVDHEPTAEYGPGAVSVFESGAIARYLAIKTGRFYPPDARLRTEIDEWLFWQVGNLGPMGGQMSHYVNYAPGDHPYSERRYRNEYHRCLGVLERRLAERDYLVGDTYTIADIVNWPWVLIAKAMGQPLDDFPCVAAWRARVKQRPAVQRGVDLGKQWRGGQPKNEAARRRLFEQTANTAATPSRE